MIGREVQCRLPTCKIPNSGFCDKGLIKNWPNFSHLDAQFLCLRVREVEQPCETAARGIAQGQKSQQITAGRFDACGKANRKQAEGVVRDQSNKENKRESAGEQH